MRLIGLVLFLGFFHIVAFAASSSATVEVKESVSIAGTEILLGDIAEIRCEDVSRADTLAAFKVGNAAAPGGKIVLTPGLLQMRLAAVGFDYQNVTMRIPDIVTVETSAQRIPGESFVLQARGYIDAQMDIEGTAQRYTIETLTVPNDLVTAVGETVYQVKAPYGIKQNAPTNIEILVYVDGKLCKKVQFRVRLHTYEQVVVTTRSLAPKEVVSGGDVHLEDMDTSNLAPGYLTEIKKAVGLVMKRVANKGTVVTAVMLDKPVLIQRMALVNLISNVAGVKVKVEGQALQDGREGDLVRVKNIKSNKAVVGKVIDETTVEVMN